MLTSISLMEKADLVHPELRESAISVFACEDLPVRVGFSVASEWLAREIGPFKSADAVQRDRQNMTFFRSTDTCTAAVNRFWECARAADAAGVAAVAERAREVRLA